ncbi:MAG: hypothetical protein V1647_06520 [Pseudomonadota bacterium]
MNRFLFVLMVSVLAMSCDMGGGVKRTTTITGEGEASLGGGECQINSDCNTGYHCSEENICVADSPGEDGDACGNHSECQQDKFCNLSLTPKECETRKPYNTACNTPFTSYCSNYCKSGSFFLDGSTKKCGCITADCSGTYNVCSSLRKRCVKKVASGGACNSTNLECNTGLTCTNGVCTACTNCCTSYTQCPANSYCDGNGQCQVGCTSLPGSPIVGTCSNGYYCDDNSGLCVPKCTAGSCAGVNTFCNLGTGVCVNKVIPGTPCGVATSGIPVEIQGASCADACTTGVSAANQNKECGCTANAHCLAIPAYANIGFSWCSSARECVYPCTVALATCNSSGKGDSCVNTGAPYTSYQCKCGGGAGCDGTNTKCISKNGTIACRRVDYQGPCSSSDQCINYCISCNCFTGGSPCTSCGPNAQSGTPWNGWSCNTNCAYVNDVGCDTL